MLRIPLDIYNPNGGAISLGHPIGASGKCIIYIFTFHHWLTTVYSHFTTEFIVPELQLTVRCIDGGI